MHELRSAVFLSPHRDDAAFSSGILLSLLLAQGIPVTVLNLFTRSAYAPYAPPGSTAESITHLRRAEDEAFLRHLNAAARPGTVAQLVDRAELDAPLRLDLPVHEVLSDPLPPDRFHAEAQRLAPLLEPLADADLVLLPLALGNHIDHRLARDAGRLVAPPDRTAFYQDLPYAARLPEETRQHTLARHAADLGDLVPLDLPYPGAAALKHALASLYPSQILPDIADQIAAYATSLGGAERLYAPALLADALTRTLHLSPVTA